MPWAVVERTIGRAGGEKQRATRQREWDRKSGANAWGIGSVIEGEFVHRDDALESVDDRSYESHFRNHSADLTELLAPANVS